MSRTMVIECANCVQQGTGDCEDCLVSFVLGRDPDDAVVIDAQEARAVRLLEGAGLLPKLRYQEQAG